MIITTNKLIAMTQERKIDCLNNKSIPNKKGGVRPGAGRPKGSLSKNTKEKRDTEKRIKEIINSTAHKLVEKQLSLALGCSYLFCVANKKAKIITDEKIVAKYLVGGLENLKNRKYYHITTVKPDNAAINSLFDRAFGKPPQQKVIAKNNDTEINVSIISYKNN